MSEHTCVQSHALTFVRTLKIPSIVSPSFGQTRRPHALLAMGSVAFDAVVALTREGHRNCPQRLSEVLQQKENPKTDRKTDRKANDSNNRTRRRHAPRLTARRHGNGRTAQPRRSRDNNGARWVFMRRSKPTATPA